MLAGDGLIRVVRETDGKGRLAERYHVREVEEAESETHLCQWHLIRFLRPPRTHQEDGQIPIYAK